MAGASQEEVEKVLPLLQGGLEISASRNELLTQLGASSHQIGPFVDANSLNSSCSLGSGPVAPSIAWHQPPAREAWLVCRGYPLGCGVWGIVLPS